MGFIIMANIFIGPPEVDSVPKGVNVINTYLWAFEDKQKKECDVVGKL